MEKIEKKENEPVLLIPEAYLKDDVDQNSWRIVARIKGTEDFVLLTPPDFSIMKSTLRGSWVKDAAIAKQRFLEFKTPQQETADIQSFVLEKQKSTQRAG